MISTKRQKEEKPKNDSPQSGQAKTQVVKKSKKKKKDFNIYNLNMSVRYRRKILEFQASGAKDCIVVFKSTDSFMGIKKDLGLTVVREDETIYTSKASCMPKR